MEAKGIKHGLKYLFAWSYTNVVFQEAIDFRPKFM